MKKYLFGLVAIVLAIGSVAFKASPNFATASFIFTGDATVVGEVEDVTNWAEAASQACPGGDEEACRIDDISDVYWHLEAGGVKVLNSNGNGDANDIDMSISEALNNPTLTYYVDAVIDGTPDNKVN